MKLPEFIVDGVLKSDNAKERVSEIVGTELKSWEEKTEQGRKTKTNKEIAKAINEAVDKAKDEWAMTTAKALQQRIGRPRRYIVSTTSEKLWAQEYTSGKNWSTLYTTYSETPGSIQCINRIRGSVLGGGYVIKKIEGQQATKKDLKRLIEFFDRPNSDDTIETLVGAGIVSLLGYGNWYMEKVPTKATAGTENEELAELYNLDSTKMKLLVDPAKKKRGVLEKIGYERKTNAEKKIIYDLKEVCHIRRPDPKGTLYGRAVSEDNTSVIQLLLRALTYNISILRNSGRPPAQIILPEDCNESDAEAVSAYFEKNFMGAHNAGKCFKPGTLILMADGHEKKVENIIVGDKVMGIDGTERLVIGEHAGTDDLFTVSQKYGDDYTINSRHILSLRWKKKSSRSGKKTWKEYEFGKVENIGVDEYLKYSPYKKTYLQGWKVGWELPARDIQIDPYFLGAWLGNGNSDSAAITTADKEVVDEITRQAEVYNLKVRVKSQKNNKSSTYCLSKKSRNRVYVKLSEKLLSLKEYAKRKGISYQKAARLGRLNRIDSKESTNKLLALFRKYNLIDNKHIPEDYLLNSREIRLELLAGLIDTDGSKSLSKSRNTSKESAYYEIIQKNKRLAYDIYYLACSLGFRTNIKKVKKESQNGTKGIYYRCNIYGDIYNIPVRINKKKVTELQRNIKNQEKGYVASPISVKEAGHGKYFGIEVDRDKLFLLKDGTVVHNTPVLFKGAKLEALGITPADMSYLDLLKLGIRLVAGQYEVPLFLIGFPEGSNRSIASESKRAYYHSNVYPLRKMICNKITQETIVDGFGIKGYRIDFRTAGLEESESARRDIMAGTLKGLYRWNEGRVKMGLLPVDKPWADEFYLLSSKNDAMLPVKDAIGATPSDADSEVERPREGNRGPGEGADESEE